MVGRPKSSESVDSAIFAALRRRGRGCVVVPADFLDLGSRRAVDVALYRLTRAGTIRRLARGVYDFPKQHPKLGPLAPPPEAVARRSPAATGCGYSPPAATPPTRWA